MSGEVIMRYTTRRISITTSPGKVRRVATRLYLSPAIVDVYLNNKSNSLRAKVVTSGMIEFVKLVEEWSEN